jgi:hypothetical protein
VSAPESFERERESTTRKIPCLPTTHRQWPAFPRLPPNTSACCNSCSHDAFGRHRPILYDHKQWKRPSHPLVGAVVWECILDRSWSLRWPENTCCYYWKRQSEPSTPTPASIWIISVSYMEDGGDGIREIRVVVSSWSWYIVVASECECECQLRNLKQVLPCCWMMHRREARSELSMEQM